MRPGLVFLLLVLCGNALSQTYKYRVSIGGVAAGTGTITDKITLAGNWLTSVKLSVTMQGEKLEIQAFEEFRPDGTPVRTMSSFVFGGGSEKTDVIYSKTNATVTTITDGKTTKKVVALPKGSIKVPSIAWLLKSRPKLGTKVAYWTLDSTKHVWEQEYDKYASKSTIPSRGKMVVTHLIESKNTKVWHDDKGGTIRMILMEDGIEILLERA